MTTISFENATTSMKSFTGTNTLVYMNTCGFTHYYHCAVVVVYSIIFIFGVIGNSVVIYILSTKERFQRKATFTSINLLAISDVLALTCSYVSDIAYGFDPERIMKYITGLGVNIVDSLSYLPFLLSLYSVVMLALVRYKVVAYPLVISKLKSPKFLIIVYLIITAICFTLLLAIALVSPETLPEDFHYNENPTYILNPALLFTIAVLFILHALKVYRLRQSLSARTYNIKSSIRRMNIAIYIIMCLFIISQLPIIICDVLEIMKRNGIDLTLSDNSFIVLVSVGSVFYLINHAINPYIYFVSYYCFQRMRTGGQTMEDRQTNERSSHM